MAPAEDVEMKNVESPAAASDAETPEVKKDADVLAVQDLREHVRQIDKAVTSKEPRFAMRVLRSLPSTRRKLNGNVLRAIFNQLYPSNADKESLIAFVENPLPGAVEIEPPRSRSAPKQPAPEVDVYLHLLVLLRLLDTNRLEEATECSQQLMNKILSQNRRTLDLIAAKCYFYHSRVFELTNKLDLIRGLLHARLRTSTCEMIMKAKPCLSTVFCATICITLCMIRQINWIKAARLEYSDAHKHLVQALRKAPQTAAVGFRQTVQKLAIVVELLLGDIPERAIFRQAPLRKALAPYFQLTQAVRLGNLQRFGEVLENFGPQFRSDHTFTLILRLRQNVIKTAIRSIGLSYSRISPKDIARKLGLDSAEDAEFIVAKAIRDGVIEATLDPEKGYMSNKESSDIYCTREPQLAFHQRISFCLDLHNQSVKAMRYPPKSYGKELESAEERREREQQDLELAKEMAEEDDDGFP
ncbi:hypothetical protein HW555_006804 [Spodoptera exigua]|uniref:PCI domain-containing protein n=1 Tax=Spodoptera exigua TaxID=7107 RepID=A0A835GDX9_SPOEX|nr:hypothetical protein HW555_006804 [Spodoptera exigua]